MPDTPLTCIDLWIKAGSSYERPGEEGIAHFLEHMIFKGGKNLKEGEFDRKIEALGGSSNAATGFDDVHFYVLVPSEKIKPALNLLIELVLYPAIEPNAFRMERKVVLEEIAQHNDQPDEQIFQKLLEICWINHPYGRPILGFQKSLNELSNVDMKSFHERLYKSTNCVISIAGNVPDEIKSLFNKSNLSKQEKNSSIDPKQKKKTPLVFKKVTKEINVDRLGISRLIMAWPSPPAQDQSLIMGFDIATSLLAEGRRSRLVEHLRENLKIVESIDMDITSLEEGGIITLEASCQKKEIEKVKKEIFLILNEYINNPAQSEEIKRAHQLVKNSLCFSLETSRNVSSCIGSQFLWGRHQPLLAPLELINYWSAENLKNEIFYNLHPDKASILIANPKK
ncbi:pitrilysin family protein [Prochlorococcus sp. MIT 1223]|uniref:M16 family metallopeptidase n=1 Tax=Prochlorococcus sp. MIT 1223 TaxID=3096217 RepID=UPI002A765982|nr:pitrilysin family protein [Prochlorococcus sp. MIT 1223]